MYLRSCIKYGSVLEILKQFSYSIHSLLSKRSLDWLQDHLALQWCQCLFQEQFTFKNNSQSGSNQSSFSKKSLLDIIDCDFCVIGLLWVYQCQQISILLLQNGQHMEVRPRFCIIPPKSWNLEWKSALKCQPAWFASANWSWKLPIQSNPMPELFCGLEVPTIGIHLSTQYFEMIFLCRWEGCEEERFRKGTILNPHKIRQLVE